MGTRSSAKQPQQKVGEPFERMAGDEGGNHCYGNDSKHQIDSADRRRYFRFERLDEELREFLQRAAITD
jgi:hypothetical protein